ncbi:MAG: tRNA (cytidine(34)-2'-O)-methyltransferase [Dehalococcoidia bacterium]
MLNILLYKPLIPHNTGNIIRLCVNIGANLHLIKPYGFELDNKHLRRAGLDYLDFSIVNEYESLNEYIGKNNINYERIFAATSKSKQLYTNVKYKNNDTFIFGQEDIGLPKSIIKDIPNNILIPMRPNNRSLNLSNSVSIVCYEAWRQLEFTNL